MQRGKPCLLRACVDAWRNPTSLDSLGLALSYTAVTLWASTLSTLFSRIVGGKRLSCSWRKARYSADPSTSLDLLSHHRIIRMIFLRILLRLRRFVE